MRLLITILLISVVFSCTPRKSTDILYFKTGQFKTYLDQKKDSSSFYRDSKYQVETYKNKVDSFKITWKSNFEYQLLKVNPKGKLDSLPFMVKITGIKSDHYDFKGHYKGNNFKQEGKTYKISD